MDGYTEATYGDRFADVYDDWYGAVSDVGATVDGLVALLGATGGGPVLELGVGTGRLALPLAERGVEVHGIDASEAMVARLRAKPGGSGVPITVGDMSDVTPPGGPYAVVFAAFNTFFNLPTRPAQEACLVRVAGVLAPGGRLAIEAFVPADEPPSPSGTVEARTVELDRVVLTVTRQDPEAHTVSGSHVEISAAGIILRPWHLCYAAPAELDAMAAAAGFDLEHRWGGWRCEAFTEASPAHVSVYRVGRR